ncbi:hypothetical protein NX722_23495 [Endozoicomonas gorgoniicola]|uniref:Uncharacterized protein n=1 Tax=Endozoicomonas gorgoniicola TaxID=1234144 RepID=A0ABT3N1M1_9GAMM|nr:hypothetical protein [Endozoicomonas gorgoniicola]MCW7555532.1 hypothetical protein [Endozoicomonas gorgoniicola]
MIDPQYPKPDSERKERIITDVTGLLKIRDDDDTRAKVGRWLHHTLIKAQKHSRRPWWFTKRVFSFIAYPGQDVFDLKGSIDSLISLHGKDKILKKPVDQIMAYRSHAYDNGNTNRGEPKIYAEFGGRLHIWPAPDKKMMLHLCFTVPMTSDIVPDEWETFLVDGVIGLYGAHFDKSGMIGEPQEFANRFWSSIKYANSNNHDIDIIERRTNYSFSAHTSGENLSTALAKVNSGNYLDDPDNIVTPAYQGVAGKTAQVLADDDSENTHGTPFLQIPGDEQP